MDINNLKNMAKPKLASYSLHCLILRFGLHAVNMSHSTAFPPFDLYQLDTQSSQSKSKTIAKNKNKKETI